MNPANPDTAGSSLHGLVVLDLTHVLAGPFATMLLADMGATVIKIETPAGEDIRHIPPFVNGQSMVYRVVNRNKQSVALNLADADGVAVLKRLVKDADVLVENFRVGAMARLGLDYRVLQEINPRLVMASISGFGQTGPYARRKGLDVIAQAMSGIMSVTGEADRPPVKCGIPISDLASGIYAAYGILCALRHRDRTGEGQYVDTSLFEVAASLSVWQAAEYWGSGRVPQRWGSGHPSMVPYGAFATQDGHVVAAVHSARLWPSFCEVVGLPGLREDPRFCSVEQRSTHRKALHEAIEARTSTQPSVWWLARFGEAGIPAGPVQNYRQVFDDAHLKARGVVRPPQAATGTPSLGNPLTMSETPWQLFRDAPALGKDSRSVLQRFGFTSEEVNALVDAGVVSQN